MGLTILLVMMMGMNTNMHLVEDTAMSEEDIRNLIAAEILAHERRVGFISGVLGVLWLLANVGVVVWLVVR
jgi:hypothetical protein